jgi:hypothetical protein
MPYQILIHTPIWAWAVLLALVCVGLLQSVARSARLRRVVVLPLAVTGLSALSTFSTFGAVPASWFMWLAGALAASAWIGAADAPAGVAYDARTRRFHLPGSWVPLALLVAIFMLRYGVAVMLAITPARKGDAAFAAIVATLYGTMSGVFLGRMLRLLRLARASAAPDALHSASWG